MFRLRGASKHFVLTGTAILSAIGLFCVPLILRYHVYKNYSISLTSSDSVTMNEWISPVWCDGQHLQTANFTLFSAYLLNTEPRYDKKHGFKKTILSQRFVIPDGVVEFWGFHLLEGSVLTVSACARMSGASLSIIKGRHVLNDCLKEHLEDDNDSSEESLETEEDSHESTVSSSEGVFSNETSAEEFECEQALNRLELSSTFTCGASQKILTNAGYNDTVTIKASVTDHYFVVFSSSSFLPILPNEIDALFELNRVVYDVSENELNCTDSNECEFWFPIDQKKYVVVEMGGANVIKPNGGDNIRKLTHDVLISTCIPRKGLYFLFYLLFFIVIFVTAFQ